MTTLERKAFTAEEYRDLADDEQAAAIGYENHKFLIAARACRVRESALRIASMRDEIVEVLKPFAQAIFEAEWRERESVHNQLAHARERLKRADFNNARALLSKLTADEGEKG